MWLLLSSEVFLGTEATRLGICQKAFAGDVFEQSLKFAKRLAATVSPVSMATMKRQVWTHPMLDDNEALRQSIGECGHARGGG